MKIVKPEKKEDCKIRVSCHMQRVAKYLAYELGLSMRELGDMAIREFASRRLPTGWEGVNYENFSAEDGGTQT